MPAASPSARLAGHSTSRLALRLLVVGVAVASLAPLARFAASWAEYAGTVGGPLSETPPRGYTGVRWTDARVGDADRTVVAADVFPGSPADDAGVRAGDRLVAVDAEPVRTAADAEARTERAAQTVQSLRVERDGRARTLDVPVAHYPTFLYPRSRLLWAGAGWAFGVVAFLHLLALVTVWPLARRRGRAQRAAALIAAGLVWVGGNLLRIAWVTAEGAPGVGRTAAVFDVLTLVALAGWVVFPPLLLRQVVLDWRTARQAVGGLINAAFVAPAVYGTLLVVALVRGHVGPLTPDALVAPVLFYVCLTVAAATGLMLARTHSRDDDDAAPAPLWYRLAGVGVLGAVLGGAAFAWQAAPATEADATAAWIVTSLQLVSLLPVVLVSLATLRYGRFDAVLLRGTAYALALGVVFATVAGAASVVRLVAPGRLGPTALGLFVVAILVVAERAAPMLRQRFARTFESDRDRARRRLDAFGERIRSLVDPDALAAAAAQAVGDAFVPRSAVVFLRAGLGGPDERWASATYRPEPPHFTAADLDRVWDRIRDGGRVWSASDELGEADLPGADAERLRAVGVSLAVPITTGDDPKGATHHAAGLIALGPTTRRRAVYTTDDVERLRLLGAQLALAVERLALIERETTLVRQTAEAELVALRAQINPHFLFNALNTVAALIAEQPDRAEATVESLAGLFRDVLTASGRPDVPLRDELRLVTRYLDVEQARFGDALRVEVETEPETLDRPVPAFAVQTLVENAVKHGIERRRGGGTLRLTARVDASGALVVVVSDTGVGVPALFGQPEASGADVHGVGLGNVAARLRGLYGSSDGLRLASSPAGTTATLTLPPRATPMTTGAADVVDVAASGQTPQRGVSTGAPR